MKTQRIAAVILALCLLSGCLAACGQDNSPAAQNVSTAEMDMIAEAASSLLPSHGSTEGKEETVYVIADAEGAPQRTIVSAWLKNPDEAGTITDRSDLSGIENVKGDETYTVDSDGNLVWDAQGSDIYYQGGSDKDLPLTVHVSYKLDGEEISPEELAGASGHLEMTFSYENKTGRQEKIGGKDVTIYQPFVAVSCLVLDSAKASSVEVTNGTLINSGEQMIVAGMAMPGLKESLGLDELEDADGETLDAEVPETVTITADVNDFSLLTSVTLVENAMLNDLDLDNVDSFDDLKSSIDKLTDASAQLVDGAGSLYDGTKSLSGGTGSLVDGAVELDAGARTIASNMGDLYNGLVSLQAGAGTLSAGVTELQNSVTDLPASAAALDAGAKAVNTALTEQIIPGFDGIFSGADQIANGAAAISSNIPLIESLFSATYQAIVEAAQPSGDPEAVKASLQSIKDSCTSDQQAVIDQAIALIDGENQALKDVTVKASTLVDKSGFLIGSMEKIKTGAEEIRQGAKNEDPAIPDIYQGADALVSGIKTITSKENLGAVIAGLDQLSESSPKLVEGVSGLAAGVSGEGGLEAGIKTLTAGAEKLSAGANDLAAGADELKSGSQSLSDGVLQVMNGASSLLNGMSEFDGDGVKVLSRLFEDDAQGFMDRLRAVQAYGEEYNSFSGLADGMPGMVRFIIRTDSIGE